jgi:hypothetical protein
MRRQLIGLGVVTLLGVGGLYIAYPDAGGNNIQTPPAASPEPQPQTLVIPEPEPVQEPAPVPVPVVEPEPLVIPVADSTFTEAQASMSCSAPPTQAVTRDEPSIYRWTDASGQIHFSDKKPAAAPAEVYNSPRSELDYFDLAINYRGQNIVPFLHDQASTKFSRTLSAASS